MASSPFRVLPAVLVVLVLVGATCGDDAESEEPLVWGEGAMPSSFPSDFPLPANAVIVDSLPNGDAARPADRERAVDGRSAQVERLGNETAIDLAEGARRMIGVLMFRALERLLRQSHAKVFVVDNDSVEWRAENLSQDKIGTRQEKERSNGKRFARMRVISSIGYRLRSCV